MSATAAEPRKRCSASVPGVPDGMAIEYQDPEYRPQRIRDPRSEEGSAFSIFCLAVHSAMQQKCGWCSPRMVCASSRGDYALKER